MTYLKKISIVNIIVLLILCIFAPIYVSTTSSNGYRSLGIIVTLMFFMSIQFIINLVLSIQIFSKDKNLKEKGKSHLLNCLLILLIGFPSCLLSGDSYNWFK